MALFGSILYILLAFGNSIIINSSLSVNILFPVISSLICHFTPISSIPLNSSNSWSNIAILIVFWSFPNLSPLFICLEYASAQ